MFAAKPLYVVPTDKLPPTYVAPEDEIAPATVKAVDGVVVPIPTLPDEFQVNTGVPSVPSDGPYPRLNVLLAVVDINP